MAAAVLAPMGLRLSEQKTKITHIDDGLDFLGWRIQRHRKRGTNRHYVYTYPARKAVQAVTGKVKDAVPTNRHEPAAPDPAAPAEPDASGLVRLLPARRVQRHLQIPQRLHLATGLRMVAPQTPPEHREGTPPTLLRGRMVAGHGGTTAVQPSEGTHYTLPIPGSSDPYSLAGHGLRKRRATAGLVERPVPGNGHAGCGRRLGETHRWKHRKGAPGRPHFYLLEAAGFETWLVNAKDVKHLPGRPKTDKLDAVWLCKLAEREMLRPSFVPPPPIRVLRDLARYRADLIGVRTAEKQRVEKLLEDAQIKLSVVASDIFGVSGRQMLAALIAGQRDPQILAAVRAWTAARGKIGRFGRGLHRPVQRPPWLLAVQDARPGRPGRHRPH